MSSSKKETVRVYIQESSLDLEMVCTVTKAQYHALKWAEESGYEFTPGCCGQSRCIVCMTGGLTLTSVKKTKLEEINAAMGKDLASTAEIAYES